MVPYFDQPVLELGPIDIHAFGLFVATAVVAGCRLALRRARRSGLDAAVTESMILYALVFGFVGSHLLAVLAYVPDRLAVDPWLIVRIWDELSSLGGIVGGLLGVWIFFRFRALEGDRHLAWQHLDAVAFAFPFAWALARLGCAVAHDHPGTITEFPLARSLGSDHAQDYIAEVYRAAGRSEDLPPRLRLGDLGFHDLGWYEFLITLGLLIPAFFLLDRRARHAGFWAVTFLLLYAPVRFALDTLRVADARHLGLTPGQWASMLLFACGALVWWSKNRSQTPRQFMEDSEPGQIAHRNRGGGQRSNDRLPDDV